MEFSAFEQTRKKIRLYWITSLALHLGLFLLVLLMNLVFPHKNNLFLPSIQVDMVALPDQTKQAEEIDTTLPVKETSPTPSSTAKEESAEAEEPEPLLKKEAVKKAPKVNAAKEAKSALEKLKAEIERERNQKSKSLADKKKEDLKRFEEAYRGAIRGNQANQGTSATGELAAAMNAYYGHIKSRLASNWSLPSWLQSKSLRASVMMYIDGNGTIARFYFTTSSGNDVFDEYVKTTLQKSSPFYAPPAEMARDLRNKGIEVSFPL